MSEQRQDNIHRLIVPNTASLRGRGIYLLPNLFTTGALFGGFYAIIAATKGHFEAACIAVLVAIVLDGLDGRIARLTNTQSDFGAEYDSLADMVSFGAAPALLAYQWTLQGIGKFGFFIAFLYAAGAALRLARFNVQKTVQDKRFFKGLPSPSAAALVATFIWFGETQGLQGHGGTVAMVVLITFAAALLMVSNLRYYSFKDLDLRGRIPFVLVLAMVATFGLISIDPPIVMMLGMLAYATSGVVLTLTQLRTTRRERRRARSQQRDAA